MKNFTTISVFCLLLSLALPSLEAQNRNSNRDIRVDVGGYHLQFHVTEGKSPTILFEAGGGDDSSAWRNTAPGVATVTGARIVTYDRAGLGKSEPNPGSYSITQEVESLERGLKQLQINGDLIVVAHSYGGFVATLFAARNTSTVKGLVLIDANLAPFFTDAVVDTLTKQAPQELEPLRKQDPLKAAVLEKVMGAFPETVRAVRNALPPASLPVTDIIAERTHIG